MIKSITQSKEGFIFEEDHRSLEEMTQPKNGPKWNQN
jgi:hypothetical protein